MGRIDFEAGAKPQRQGPGAPAYTLSLSPRAKHRLRGADRGRARRSRGRSDPPVGDPAGSRRLDRRRASTRRDLCASPRPRASRSRRCSAMSGSAPASASRSSARSSPSAARTRSGRPSAHSRRPSRRTYGATDYLDLVVKDVIGGRLQQSIARCSSDRADLGVAIADDRIVERQNPWSGWVGCPPAEAPTPAPRIPSCRPPSTYTLVNLL